VNNPIEVIREEQENRELPQWYNRPKVWSVHVGLHVTRSCAICFRPIWVI